MLPLNILNMKTITNTTIYRCEHCNKLYQIGSACIKHELKCDHNKENWTACTGCVFLKNTTKDLSYENDYGYEVIRQSNAFFCDAKNIGLYPPKAVHKDLINRFPNSFKGEERMPTECSLRDDDFGF